MKHRGLEQTKTRTIYNEKYFHRAKHVTRAEALSIVKDASVIYAVEQGEIEIPSFEKQRRLVVVMRFERIVPAETPAAVDPVGETVTLRERPVTE